MHDTLSRQRQHTMKQRRRSSSLPPNKPLGSLYTGQVTHMSSSQRYTHLDAIVTHQSWMTLSTVDMSASWVVCERPSDQPPPKLKLEGPKHSTSIARTAAGRTASYRGKRNWKAAISGASCTHVSVLRPSSGGFRRKVVSGIGRGSFTRSLTRHAGKPRIP